MTGIGVLVDIGVGTSVNGGPGEGVNVGGMDVGVSETIYQYIIFSSKQAITL
jgi:hypothetical protein